MPPQPPIEPSIDGGATTRTTVVVGVDGSPGARMALAWALSEAARRGAETLVVSTFSLEVYGIDPSAVDPHRVESIRHDIEARARELVQEVRQDAEVSAVPGTAEVPVHVVVGPGPAAPVLVQQSTGADLLVVGSRGRGGIRSTFLGSVALYCATHANCPVVVIRPRTAVAPAGATAPRVVVGLSDSQHAGAVLVTAVEEARRRGARIEAVLAYEEPNPWSERYAVMTRVPGQSRARAQEFAEDLVADVLGDDRDAVDVMVAEGPAGEALVRQATGAQLLVVGSRSRGRSPLPSMALGSVALYCVVHAPCPVMVVRPLPELEPSRPSAAATRATFA